MSIYPEPSSSIMTSSSRRRTASKAAKGVSLGLEDEADFGSDEDTMEAVGVIREDAPAPVWYPGMPEPAPTERPASKWRSKSDKKTVQSKLGKRGLGDAKVIMHNPGSENKSAEPNGLGSLIRDKNKSKVFGKLFKRKESDGTSSVSGVSRYNQSAESFGSGRASDSSSLHPSQMVASAPMPPTHHPIRHRGPSQQSDKESARETLQRHQNTLTDQPRDTQTGGTGQPSVNGSDHAGNAQSQPAFQVLGVPASKATDAPTVESSNLTNLLVPPFPTSELALESTTILSTTVMRRVNFLHDKEKWAAPLRSGQSSATLSSPSTRRTIWQTHQLVLTSFRINKSTPQSSPISRAIDSSDPAQTVAHLHLFAFQTPPRAPPISYQGGSAGRRRPTVNMEGAGKVEVDRRAIGPQTVAGVWKGDDTEPAHGRRWVMRVKLDDQTEEWLCDMPSGDTLYEWVHQIKAHVVVIRSEKNDLGLPEKSRSITERDAALRSLQGGYPSPQLSQSSFTASSRREGAALGIGTAPGEPKIPLPVMTSLPPPLPAPSYPPPSPPSLPEPSLPTSTDAPEQWTGQFDSTSSISTTRDVPKTPAESPGEGPDVLLADSTDQFCQDSPRSSGLEGEIGRLKLDDSEKRSAGHTPPFSVRNGDDRASISSKGSSTRAARRLKKAVPVMDLMAEVSSRPEMNYEQFIEETEPIIEDRPRKIRFQ